MKSQTNVFRQQHKSAYADLGYPDPQAMEVKAQLVTKIADILDRRKLTQTEAARLLRLPQPKLSNILRGQFRGVSERRLLDCLRFLGSDVEIIVRPATRSRHQGKLLLRIA